MFMELTLTLQLLRVIILTYLVRRTPSHMMIDIHGYILTYQHVFSTIPVHIHAGIHVLFIKLGLVSYILLRPSVHSTHDY